MKIKTWLIFLFLVPCFFVFGEVNYSYSIHYAGLPVARTIITHDTTDSIQTITVVTSSKGLMSAFFSVENTYVSSCSGDYFPNHFWKTIHQQNVQEKKVIVFRENDVEIRDVHNNKIDTLFINEPVFDVVSFTFALLAELPMNKTYPCYGNYRLWDIKATLIKKDRVFINNNEYQCDVYKIKSSVNFDSKIDSKTDILTNNIFKPNGVTYYWIDPEKHLLVKAKYKRFPFSIFMYLNEITEQ